MIIVTFVSGRTLKLHVEIVEMESPMIWCYRTGVIQWMGVYAGLIIANSMRAL